MQSTEYSKRTREVTKQVSVRQSTYQKLRNYIESQTIRPLLTDVVSEAVEQWLAREGKGGKA